MIAKEIIVKGRVQGVFFRKSAQAKALELGIYGFVKNLPNGDVFIMAQGEEEALNPFLSWCREGPPLSKVVLVEIAEAKTESKFTGFDIR